MFNSKIYIVFAHVLEYRLLQTLLENHGAML